MHIPVMLNEVMKFLNIKTSGIYIDATFGCGGYTKKLLTFLKKNGNILVLDKDPIAIELAKNLFINDERITICHNSFQHINYIVLKYKKFLKVDGIMVDLGVSSLQLEDYSRGFSFNNNGILDMRMDKSQKLNAFTWLNQASLENLEMVLYQNGDKSIAKQVAYGILCSRKLKPIRYTNELINIINRVCFIQKKKSSILKVFQAIRIFINNELNELEIFLIKSLSFLKIGGRLIIVSFNSSEDKIIKHFMKKQMIVDYKNSNCNLKFKSIVKYLKPSINELDINIRSRSAVMRVIERIE